jgi:hypothetical protein
MMKKIMLLLILTASQAQAVTLGEIIRNCRADGKALCPNASYGKAMQTCLAQHMKQLSPACKPIVVRLNNGEKVTFF